MDIGYEACDCMYIPSKVSRADCDACYGSGLSYYRWHWLPYDGPKLYPKVAVQHLLDRNICAHQHIHWAVKASRRVDTADLSKTLQLAERLVQQILGDDAVKEAMLSLIGLWGKAYSVQWHVERTRVKEDMDRVTMIGVDAEGVPPTHKAHTVILTNHSYMPVSLHVLYQEAVWMDKIMLRDTGAWH